VHSGSTSSRFRDISIMADIGDMCDVIVVVSVTWFGDESRGGAGVGGGVEAGAAVGDR